jgi:formiminotetrahydrofolate cyclodeaminase
MEAFKTKDEIQIEEANKYASQVPLTVMQKSLEVLKMAEVVANKGNENSVTDAGVAALMALAAIEGAGYNVKINLTSITDTTFVDKLKNEANNIIKEGKQIANRVDERVESLL